MTSTLRWSPLAVLLALPLAAQEDRLPVEEPPLVALSTGDDFAVEVARRRFAAKPAAQLPVPALLRISRETVVARRRAANWLLARAAGELEDPAVDDRLAEWARGETDAAVLVPSLEFLPLALLRERLRTDQPAEVVQAVLLELWRRDGFGGLATVDWGALLGSGDLELVRAAAGVAVQFAAPLPLSSFVTLQGWRRSVVLAALARRPRPAAAADWLVALHEGEPAPLTEPLDRVHLLLAIDPRAWTPADHRFLLDGLLGAWPDDDGAGAAVTGQYTTIADAFDLLDAPTRDRLLGAVHARLMDGAAVGDLLPALDGISPRGELQLAGIARSLPDAGAEEVLFWLLRRSSDAATRLLTDLFDRLAATQPRVLAASGSVIAGDDERSAQRAARVLEWFRDPDSSAERRDAAFDALTDAQRYTPELVDHVLAETGVDGLVLPRRETARRLRKLLELGDALTVRDLGLLLSAERGPDRGAVLRLLAKDAVARPDRAELLLAVLGDPQHPAHREALLAALRYAPEPLARQAWQRLDDGERAMVAVDVQRRDAAWGGELLRELAARRPALEDVQDALLRLGDRAAAERLLTDPAAYSDRFLRRTDDVVARLLVAADTPRVLEILASSAGERRLAVLRWLATNPELGGVEVLRPLAAQSSAAAEAAFDDEVLEERYIALRGLVRRPAERARLRDELALTLAAGFDVDGRERVLAVLGAIGEVDADPRADALLAARLALVEPLARARAELARAQARAALPYANALIDTLRALPSKTGEAAVASALAEQGERVERVLLRRDRFGRLLTLALRESEVFDLLSAPVAAAMLAVPSLDTDWRAAANHLLADAHADRGEFESALSAARDAAVFAFDDRLRPLERRAIFGDHYPGGGERPAAWLAARPLLLQAEQALRDGAEKPTVTALLDTAAELGGWFDDDRDDFRLRRVLADLRTRNSDR